VSLTSSVSTSTTRESTAFRGIGELLISAIRQTFQPGKVTARLYPAREHLQRYLQEFHGQQAFVLLCQFQPVITAVF
jgi:hypothetical protein